DRSRATHPRGGTHPDRARHALQRRARAFARGGAGGRAQGSRARSEAAFGAGGILVSLHTLGVEYLNARPLCEALKGDARIALSFAAPSEIARALAENEADVGLMPVAAAATIGDLRLLRNMALGARGRVRSVAIFGEKPIHELDSIAL